MLKAIDVQDAGGCLQGFLARWELRLPAHLWRAVASEPRRTDPAWRLGTRTGRPRNGRTPDSGRVQAAGPSRESTLKVQRGLTERYRADKGSPFVAMNGSLRPSSTLRAQPFL